MHRLRGRTRLLAAGVAVASAAVVVAAASASAVRPVRIVGWSRHVINGDPMVVPARQWVVECTPIWGPAR